MPRLGFSKTAENVAVIITSNAEPQRIADHDARVRGLPDPASSGFGRQQTMRSNEMLTSKRSSSRSSLATRRETSRSTQRLVVW
jgi:hypothetical protein